MAESKLTVVAPPCSCGRLPGLVACFASPSAAFDGIVGHFHLLWSTGSVGMGPTFVLA